MNWEFDKIAHYNFCYNLTNKLKLKPLKFTLGFILTIFVSIFKELVYDLLLGQGHPSFEDVYANFVGWYDASMGKPNRFC